MYTLAYTKLHSNITHKYSNGFSKSSSLFFAIPMTLQISHEEKVMNCFVLSFSKLNQLQTIKEIQPLFSYNFS